MSQSSTPPREGEEKIMTGYIPDMNEMIGYMMLKIAQERRDLRMKDTTETELFKAIQKYKEVYGIKTPLDMFKLDEIIDKMREEKK